MAALAFVLLISACSKEEEKLELFSPEAFAYSIDSEWELNASCRIKGFTQKEENGLFTAKLSFATDIKTPDGKIFSGISKGLIDETGKDRFSDLPIETQIQMDSTFKSGNYIIFFKVKDDLSGESATIQKEFELTE